MNWNRNTIFSLLIIFVTVVAGGALLFLRQSGLIVNFFKAAEPNAPISFVQLQFSEKNYKLNGAAYPKDLVASIALFEGDEAWQGDGNLDDTLSWLGGSSLFLESRDNTKKEAYFSKKFDFSKYQIFKLAIYLQSDPADLESLKLYFGNQDKSAYFYYPVTNLTPGWNFLKISKMKFSSFNGPSNSKTSASFSAVLNWGNIGRMGVELSSRYNSVATINIDNITALQSEDYLDDWLTLNSTFLDLAKLKDGNTILMAKNIGASTALIKKISGVSDFTFKGKIQPLKVNARSGLFIRGDYRTGYGYYFLIDGVNGNRWQIFKIGLVDKAVATTVLRNGIINNFVVDVNKPLWLKVEVKGSLLKFYLSTDSKSYTLLGEVNDGEFNEGGVGIVVYDAGVTQFDEMEFTR